MNLTPPDWRFQDGLGDYEDGSVAGISVSHALMFLPLEDWPAAFAEFARVLEPGGVLRVTEDSTADPASERYGGFPGAVTLTSRALVGKHMQQAGLHVSRAKGTKFHDDSLVQEWHGTEPKVFHIEGIKA